MHKLKELRALIASLEAERNKAKDQILVLTATGDTANAAAKATAYSVAGEKLEAAKSQLATLEAFEAELLADARKPAGAGARVEDLSAKKPWASLGEMLRAVVQSAIPGRSADPRLYEMAPAGASIQVPADGGYLVGAQYSSELLKQVYDRSLVAGRCRPQPIGPGFNRFVQPFVDQTSRVTGSRNGGVRGYWAAEGGTVTATKPKTANLEIQLEKLMAIGYATDEILEDAVQLENLMRESFTDEIAWELDNSILHGNGVGQCLGVMSSAALVTVAKETSQAAATIVGANIDKMWGRMWARSRGNAVWFVNQDCEQQLHSLVRPIKNVAGSENVGGSVDGPMYVAPGTTNNPNPFGLLYNRPVIVVEQAKTLGTLGDIVFADLSQYVLVTKGETKVDTSMHVEFLSDQTAFRVKLRVGGAPAWKSALTPANGTATLSPFVALATRS